MTPQRCVDAAPRGTKRAGTGGCGGCVVARTRRSNKIDGGRPNPKHCFVTARPMPIMRLRGPGAGIYRNFKESVFGWSGRASRSPKAVFGRGLGAIVRALFLAGSRCSRSGAASQFRCAELPCPSAAPNPNTYDWSGFYLGGHIGYAWGRSNCTATSTGPNGPPVAGSLNFSQPPSGWTGTGSYFAGLQAGYNLMLPSRFVVGVETRHDGSESG